MGMVDGEDVVYITTARRVESEVVTTSPFGTFVHTRLRLSIH